jgi:signal transduction histidine kinase
MRDTIEAVPGPDADAVRIGGTAAAQTFPVVAVMEALDAWLRDPSPDRRSSIRDALAAVVGAAGAAGAFLFIDRPPLPAFSVAFGTLMGADTAAMRDGVARHDLAADDGRVHLGTLWLDAPAPEGALTARVLELALDAAWSRATVHRTAERLEALDAATRGIAAVLELEPVLQLIVDRVRDLVGARYAALGTADAEGQIDRFITSGISPEERARIGAPPRGRGLLGLIIREGRAYRVPDIAEHPDSSGFPPNHPVMRTFLGVPLTVKGRSVGNLYLTEKTDGSEFSSDDQGLVEMFAVRAAIAIENARLHDQVQRLAIVEERERIGKDLHDGIIQGIYGICLSLEDVPDLMREDQPEAVARVDRAIDGLHLTIRDIRNFILGLESELLHGSDLVAGLATLAHEFRLNTLVEVELDLDEGRANPTVEQRVQLLLIAREALSNTARHAQASRVRVALAPEADHLALAVSDDGIGFEPERAVASGHLGLSNMQGRAAAIGAELIIDSRPGDGTRIIIRLPSHNGNGPSSD